MAPALAAEATIGASQNPMRRIRRVCLSYLLPESRLKNTQIEHHKISGINNLDGTGCAANILKY